MELSRIAGATAALAATRSRLAKRAIIADVVRDTTVADVEVTVSYLSGSLRQRRTGIGWRSLSDPPPPADASSLTVTEVDAAMSAVAGLTGPGSVGRRVTAVQELFARATAPEQDLLRGLVFGELRQGALEAQVQDGIAAAYAVDAAVVRRAAMLLGSTSDTALLLLTGGEAALRAVQLQVGIAVQPMLAASAPDVAGAFSKSGGAKSGGAKSGGDGGPRVVDAKLDGIRLQVHKQGEQVRLFTRSLDEVTSRMPEIVAAVRELPYDQLVIDGEALLVRPDGRPESFQVIASRTATREAAEPGEGAGGRLSLFAFDLLRVDDTDLLDVPLRERVTIMATVLPATLRVDRLVTDDPDAANAFFLDAVAHGYEGVVIKNPEAPYAAGRRDSGWVKVKPRHTFDLVVLAAEWGHGRRVGWLSNLHLGARSADGEGWVMLGKTFKGLTDELLGWQTEQLLAREVRRTQGTVFVEPTLVVEIAVDGLQRSTRYPGGVALRFARVLRYRDDKPAAEADTLDTVISLLPVTD